MSILDREYNNANFKEKKVPVFYDEVNVSLLDIIGEKEVEVKSKIYDTCLCKSSTNLSDYFKECDKCKGKGSILINQREFVCNKCK